MSHIGSRGRVSVSINMNTAFYNMTILIVKSRENRKTIEDYYSLFSCKNPNELLTTTTLRLTVLLAHFS